jgi:hypothetical protein
MVLLANCLIASGEHEEALDLAIEAREVYISTLGEDHWRTAVAIGAEGAALFHKGSLEQAEPKLLSSHSVLSRDSNALPRYVDQAAQRLAELYSQSGKPELAAEYLAMTRQ